ncbi:hypothetical protein BHE74_00045457 [Ensete ventricosum]|nr:hypothetical protein BHE74_00045457 [Ensete ventricosum]RZS28985.1 hypothetical protein BHM03_00062646 [Ensete ventricosum]
MIELKIHSCACVCVCAFTEIGEGQSEGYHKRSVEDSSSDSVSTSSPSTPPSSSAHTASSFSSRSLDKSISSLEMELAVARMNSNGGSSSSGHGKALKKAFAVIGINTGFSSKKRRESVRQTWMPRGTPKSFPSPACMNSKSVVVRFVIGHSATPGGALDRAIDAEDAETKDFLRLDHLEGYHELSSKTRVYFATAVAIWDADFYLKVDDDVHVNLGLLFALPPCPTNEHKKSFLH